MNRGVSEEPERLPPGKGDVDIDVGQLKQLVEIQTQIVKLAKQNKRTRRGRTTFRARLTGSPRRLLRLLAQLW